MLDIFTLEASSTSGKVPAWVSLTANESPCTKTPLSSLLVAAVALYAEKVQIASAARMYGRGNRIVVLGVNWLTFDFITDVYAKIWHCVVVYLIINNDFSALLMANYRSIQCFSCFPALDFRHKSRFFNDSKKESYAWIVYLCHKIGFTSA